MTTLDDSEYRELEVVLPGGEMIHLQVALGTCTADMLFYVVQQFGLGETSAWDLRVRSGAEEWVASGEELVSEILDGHSGVTFRLVPTGS